MPKSSSASSSQRQLTWQKNQDASVISPAFMRPLSVASAKDIQFRKVVENNDQVTEETVMQVEFENESLLRKAKRSQLASKNACLTRRWQTALVINLALLGLGAGIGGLAYWLTLPKVITKPFLLYGESCYMNSRSCDADRMLWCPDSECLCVGDFQWNATAQNCSCRPYEWWTGLKCQGYGYYGDPCNTIPCQPTLTCSPVINQTCSTGQDICVCDNQTYLYTLAGSNQGTCVPRLSYGQTCLTNFDCQNWVGLECANFSLSATCQCDSTTYWNGSYCITNALGWQPCSATVPCDTRRALTCSNITNTCECDAFSYWDNVTTIWCETLKTYAVTCQYNFQCNATVGLSCPNVSAGCNCPDASYAGMCDCQSGEFWDGQRCIAQHTFNSTCPGQYACTSNLDCYLGHCVCLGQKIWVNTTLPPSCQCPTNTTWNAVHNLCM